MNTQTKRLHPTPEGATAPHYEPTPGPWDFDRDWNRIPTIFGPDRRQMIATVEKHVTQTGIYTQKDLPEREANARLIAAAPDMLAALKNVRDAHRTGHNASEAWGWVDAAIARTEASA